MTSRQILAARREVLEDTDNHPPLTVDLWDMFGRADRPPIDDGSWDYDTDDSLPDDVDRRTDLAVRLACVAQAHGWTPESLLRHYGCHRSAVSLVDAILDLFDQEYEPVSVFRELTDPSDDEED